MQHVRYIISLSKKELERYRNFRASVLEAFHIFFLCFSYCIWMFAKLTFKIIRKISKLKPCKSLFCNWFTKRLTHRIGFVLFHCMITHHWQQCCGTIPSPKKLLSSLNL